MEPESLIDLSKKKKINDEIYSIIFKIIDEQRNHINNINDRVKILEESRLQTLPTLKKKGSYANFKIKDFSTNLSSLSRKIISKKKHKKQSKKIYGRK